MRANADKAIRPDVDAVENVTDKLQLAAERRVAALLTGCANWASASNPSVKWDNDASDPLSDIETAKNAVIKQTGTEPNVCIISRDTWRYLRKHPDVVNRFVYTSRGPVTVAMFADLIEIPKILIGNSIYNSAAEGATDSMSFIWGDMLWMGYVAPNPGLRQPSSMYVFQWGANEVNRYREGRKHTDIIEVMHSVDEIISSSISGAIFSDCIT